MLGAAAAYNSGMVTFRAPSGVSEELRHAVELVNRDLDGLLDELDTHEQGEFWSNLHQYAQAQTEGKGRRARLVASPGKVGEAVREALEMADGKIAAHLESVDRADCERFWQMLYEAAEEQAHETKHPKARHGGGKR